MKKVFNTTDTSLLEHNGKVGTIIRELTEKEVDLFDVGIMYKFKLETGEIIDVFKDELTKVK